MAITTETRTFIACDNCGHEESTTGTFADDEAIRDYFHGMNGFDVEDGKDYCGECRIKLFHPEWIAAAYNRILRGQ